MPINLPVARNLLKRFAIKKLFIEQFGWDSSVSDINVSINGTDITLSGMAHKRGLAVYCLESNDRHLPDYGLRRKIENQVRKSTHEHLIIFTNADHTHHIWQWVKREPGKPTACRELEYTGQTGEFLLQQLQGLCFTLDEEENLGIADVTSRVRATFDLERVTRKFYDRFKEEHAIFLKFLKGIPDEGMARWYVSVTLNRLMFVYFIQKKRFLDDDENYLQNHLAQSPKGENRFYGEFLCPLFFEGFAKRENERSQKATRMLGVVPYLNGGIFQQHQLEIMYGRSIQISDEAFSHLFNFFDQYRWHLDERPLRQDNEINPDVLGYIFEKYINQKEMGAYYTKDDITGYICRNTVLPHLLEQTRKDCAIAFEASGSIWRLLRADPLRYIFPAMQHGCDKSLPEQIQEGVGNIALRGAWNKLADPVYGLPTETWREAISRRNCFEGIHNKLTSGQIHSICDLITYNLDIQQLTQDIIESSEGPDLLRAFWKAITTIRVLDPTCGSGAFLFAALNILEPLYEACLERMRAFTSEKPGGYNDFLQTLSLVDDHPNRRYFIMKSIIVNNLYGVDIMDEAVEICKLRLFLKLIAQVELAKDVEPLPDIDFNIRAGNTLIGFTTRDEVRRALTSQGQQGTLGLFGENKAADQLEELAEQADKAFQHFRQMQIAERANPGALATAKEALRKQLDSLNDGLNRALALHYLDTPMKEEKYKKWLIAYRPFHWFVDFYGIMKSGGFDVIIGNPPYIEYSKIKKEYELPKELLPYATNLYSVCCFRSTTLKKQEGYASFIVPVSLPSTDRMEPLRMHLAGQHSVHHVSFSTRPSKLFDGAEQRLTIYLQTPSTKPAIYSGGYMKWYKEERAHLFEIISFTQAPALANRHNIWPKIRGQQCLDIFQKMLAFSSLAQSNMLGPGARLYYKNTGIRYFNTVTLRSPKCWINGEAAVSSRETILNTLPKYMHVVHTFLLSTIFFMYWETTTNCRDLNPADIHYVPIPPLNLEASKLDSLSLEIERDYISKGKILHMNNKLTGAVDLESLTPARSKSWIDRIDYELAIYYGFSPEQLDFIQNFEIKYRLGADEDEI